MKTSSDSRIEICRPTVPLFAKFTSLFLLPFVSSDGSPGLVSLELRNNEPLKLNEIGGKHWPVIRAPSLRGADAEGEWGTLACRTVGQAPMKANCNAGFMNP